jgi:tetratricopeptide (TPR) repeat protein
MSNRFTQADKEHRMNPTPNRIAAGSAPESAALATSAPASLTLLPETSQAALLRMFADPYLLQKDERSELVTRLRKCVDRNPDVSELRVLLGMALCVNFEPQAAIEELGEAVALDPGSFIAHLKMGELWMRLRVITKAEDHTRQAAMVAQNLAQVELARKQAATIRTMRREGVERGGSRRTSWLSLSRLRRFWTKNRDEEALATVDVG